MPVSLAAWVGYRVDHMDKDALLEAAKHYRDAGHRSFGEFRHHATSGVSLRNRGETTLAAGTATSSASYSSTSSALCFLTMVYGIAIGTLCSRPSLTQ